MFKKLFGKAEKAEPSTVFLFVCLSGGTFDCETFAQKLKELEGIEVETEGASTTSVEIGGVTVALGHMPIPIPGDEVQQAAMFSTFWNKENSPVHASHVIVFGAGEKPLDTLSSVARLARVVSSSQNAVAWYCGNSGQILDPEFGEKLAENAPLPIFVNALISVDERGCSSSTFGMESLGHKEFEIVDSRQPPEDVRELILDAAHFVLDRGDVLRHGQTFGRTMDEKFSIEIGRSKLGKPGKVIRLGY